jgi:hypothetical protein
LILRPRLAVAVAVAVALHHHRQQADRHVKMPVMVGKNSMDYLLKRA